MAKRERRESQDAATPLSSRAARSDEVQAAAGSLPPAPPDASEARVTIHPRISPRTERIGELLARQRGRKVMSFWSDVVEKGLPVVAALGQPDAQGRYGPWTGEELARELRLLVAQLIEFQIQYHQTPGHLLTRIQAAEAAPPAPLAAKAEAGEASPPAVFEAATDTPEAGQGFSAMGFGELRIFGQQEESGQ